EFRDQDTRPGGRPSAIAHTEPAKLPLCPERNIHSCVPRGWLGRGAQTDARCYLRRRSRRGVLGMLVRLVSITFVAASCFGLAGGARAAELRIPFEELTRLVQSIAAETQIYLNSVPGGLFTTSSSIKIGSQSYPLPPLEKKFVKGGSTYAYY